MQVRCVLGLYVPQCGLDQPHKSIAAQQLLWDTARVARHVAPVHCLRVGCRQQSVAALCCQCCWCYCRARPRPQLISPQQQALYCWCCCCYSVVQSRSRSDSSSQPLTPHDLTAPLTELLLLVMLQGWASLLLWDTAKIQQIRKCR
jgi:hypothetical protein